MGGPLVHVAAPQMAFRGESKSPDEGQQTNCQQAQAAGFGHSLNHEHPAPPTGSLVAEPSNGPSNSNFSFLSTASVMVN